MKSRRRQVSRCQRRDEVVLYTGTSYEHRYNVPCARLSCPDCEPVLMEGNEHPTLPGFDARVVSPGRLTPGGYGLRPHKTFLGTRRTPYAKWSKTATLYTWPLWCNWKPPKPIKVETGADIRKRERAWLRSAKPIGYTWRIETLTPAQRIALGCLPPVHATPEPQTSPVEHAA